MQHIGPLPKFDVINILIKRWLNNKNYLSSINYVCLKCSLYSAVLFLLGQEFIANQYLMYQVIRNYPITGLLFGSSV